MVDQPNSVARVKLRKISVMKFSFIFSLIGLISGIIQGFPLFIFARALIDGWVQNVPVSGLAIASFVLFPLISAFLFWIFGMIFGLIVNLSFKLTNGLDMLYEELD